MKTIDWKRLAVLALSAFIVWSCSRNTVINIGSEEQEEFLSLNGQTLFALNDSKIEFTKRYGAEWTLSGNVSSLAQIALNNVQRDVQSLFVIKEMPLILDEIEVAYGDGGGDAVTTYPHVILKLGVVNASGVPKCEIGPLTHEYDHPVNHGFLASDQKKREMLKPAYEQLIVYCFERAFMEVQKCLSNESA